MVIDFHTHVFPEKLAPRAVESLQRGIASHWGHGQGLPMFSDATLASLERSMEEHGIDISVVLPIATAPRQTTTINEYAKKISRGGIISFGSVYPGQDGWEKTVEQLARDGFRGIKLHPEFQDFYIDSRESVQLINKCRELGLTVVIHAGVDYGIAPPVRCTPERLRNALNYFQGDNLVAAHLGGFVLWDEVEKYLIDTPVIFDTAMISRYIDPALCADIIRRHGMDKIVCGSDSPWEDQSASRSFLKKIGFTEDELAGFDKNAAALLWL